MLYPTSHYGDMIADHIRTSGYAEALRRAVTPGSTVVELGTGPGLFALLACGLGARRVYAIEPEGIIQLAREIARANGYGDRIEFIEGISTQATLPERVDVLVADLRGALPPFRRSLSAMADARCRFLRPGGTIIPRRDILRVAPAEAPDLYWRRLSPWIDRPYGVDMARAVRLLTNTWGQGRVTMDQLVALPRTWAVLDYLTVENPDAGGTATWKIDRARTVHGFSVWFEADLADGIRFTTGPDGPETVFGSPFFPLEAPIEVAAGDTLEVALKAASAGERYIWRWDTRVLVQGDPGRVKARLTQSDFLGAPLSPRRLRKRAAARIGALNEAGRMDRLVLALLEEGTSLGDIAARLVAQFPAQFRRWEDALTRVGDLSVRYTE